MAAGEAGQEAAGRVVPWLARGESMGAAQEGTAESSLAFSGSFNRSGGEGEGSEGRAARFARQSEQQEVILAKRARALMRSRGRRAEMGRDEGRERKAV